MRIVTQQLEQTRVQKHLFFTHGLFLQYPEIHQGMKVPRSCLTLCNIAIHQVPDAAVRLLENHVHQLPGVDLGQPRTNMLSRVVGKLADGAEWPADLIPLAEGFVHDAHAKDAFGGTGKVSDWTRFQKLVQKYPQSLWILAGGLGPDNIAAAAKSGAGFFDLNSGIELAPGLKSAEKMAGVSDVLLKNSQS